MPDITQCLRCHMQIERGYKHLYENDVKEGYGNLGSLKYEPILIFDTETTVDDKQGLKVGCAYLINGNIIQERYLFYVPKANTEEENNFKAIHKSLFLTLQRHLPQSH